MSSGIIHDSVELRKFITENPDLPIVVLAGEYAWSGEYGYEYCTNVTCGIEEILDCKTPFNKETVFTDQGYFEEQLSDYLAELPGFSDLTDEEFDGRLQEEIAKYNPYWKKVIAIYADN